jgi:hypothetical protein
MPKYKVGDHPQVKLSGGRIVEATVKSHSQGSRQFGRLTGWSWLIRILLQELAATICFF